MTTSKKKNIRWKALSAPLIVGAVGVWTFLGMNWLWDLSSANSSISDANRVSVEGVENSAQYLTSMVLHMGDEWPNDTKVVTLYYDTGAKALHISGNVNANALIIGNKNEALSGTTAIGGEGNKILGGSENALIMGGRDNSLTSGTNSIILGGRRTRAVNANNLAIIGASDTSVPREGTDAPKENILVAGGNGNTVKWSNVVILWEGNNEAGSDSVLIGKNIKASNAQKVFVWSDDGTFSPKKSGAFYVNTKNGIWFNTNDPKVKFDIGGLGGKWAIKIAAKWGFVSGSGKCNEEYAGLMAYVKAWGKSGLCGCNGAERVPLSSDPSTHGVCVNMKQRACTGWVANAVWSTPDQALPKWNPELKAGDGGWEDVKWVYGGIQYPGSTGKECGYTCQTGYHAGADFPDGWQMWGCKACTEIANRYTKEKPDGSTFSGWWTPGTGNDNCHFGCKAGYKHKDQPGVERSCSGCNIGTYTPENNQRAECKDCEMPTINKQGLQEFITHASTRGGTAMTINSGFKAWTTTGVSSTSCQFHCDERFGRDHRDLTNKWSCTFCAAGTYSSGDVAQCWSCTPIANATFITNGTKNRTDPSSSRLDCDFNCSPKYGYHNNGGADRWCTPCTNGQYSKGEQNVCEECPKSLLPAGAKYEGGAGTNANDCPWVCPAWYYKSQSGNVRKCVRVNNRWWDRSCSNLACDQPCTQNLLLDCINSEGQREGDLRRCYEYANKPRPTMHNTVVGTNCVYGECWDSAHRCRKWSPQVLTTYGGYYRWRCIADRETYCSLPVTPSWGSNPWGSNPWGSNPWGSNPWNPWGGNPWGSNPWWGSQCFPVSDCTKRGLYCNQTCPWNSNKCMECGCRAWWFRYDHGENQVQFWYPVGSPGDSVTATSTQSQNGKTCTISLSCNGGYFGGWSRNSGSYSCKGWTTPWGPMQKSDSECVKQWYKYTETEVYANQYWWIYCKYPKKTGGKACGWQVAEWRTVCH